VHRIVNESIAASMAYGVANKGGGDDAVAERKVLVFDLGGGTLDVSIQSVDRHGYLEALATSSDSRLGGEDFDRRVMDYFVGRARRWHGRDIVRDARAMEKLRRECERAKHALSGQCQVRVEVEKLVDGVDLSEQLTRARFEELNGDLFRKTMAPAVRKALPDAGMSKADIDDVVLVGGSTRIPKAAARVLLRRQGAQQMTGASTPTRPRTAPPSREASSAATTSTRRPDAVLSIGNRSRLRWFHNALVQIQRMRDKPTDIYSLS
jgi:molecular chaperone DnaK (HSP70)